MGSPQQFILGFKMKWTLCLLCVASVATALPTRDKKAFSLFSVVTFPNAECTTDTTPAMTGICVTAEECSNDGDVIAQAQGNCASGFGVCCMRRVEGNPNAAITSGLTYVQSPGFPQAVAALNPAAGAAVAAVQRDFNIMGGPNVCQIRFDFITASVTAPAAAAGAGVAIGDCATDSISINTPTRTALQTGVLAGQHLIVEVAPGTNAMAATLNIDTGAVAGNRMWKILVKCVECDSADRAPMGCNQFFTDASGRISSFNGPQAITDGTHMLLENLEYTICFRQIAGMCGVRLTQARQQDTAPDSFALATAANTAVAAGTASTVGTCAVQFLRVPDAIVTTAAGVATNPRRVCGGFLSSQQGEAQSGAIDNMGFEIGVFSRGGGSVAGTGFDLLYSQTPCS